VISPKLVEVGRHKDIELITLAEVISVSGTPGHFQAHVRQYPRYVDVEKCIACGVCAEKCPKKVPNAYEGGLIQRRAAYLKYAQAVPLKYAIDADQCIYLTKGKCKACEKFCPTGAIDLKDHEKELHLDIGAVVLATGVQPYDPGRHDTFGYGRYPNVVTSLEFERILSASGPFGGHLVRPSDKEPPQKIAWLQCVGSRDEHPGAHGYCSAVCCTYAVKEAILAKEHTKGKADTAVFYIDIRTHGKDFERYYNRAREELGVRFVKAKITNIRHDEETGGSRIHYLSEDGESVSEGFDIVVLSIGLEASDEGIKLAERLQVNLDSNRFAETPGFQPVNTSRPGIFVCGAFQSPKDIPSSVIESSAAAGAAGALLSDSRFSRIKSEVRPPETDVRGEPPRIGVFVCRCGTNIAGVVDVPGVVGFAAGLPGVVHAEENVFSCSQDSLEKMTKMIQKERLNRVIVAACTPRTHEPIFQQTLIQSGINKYLFEMVNIRNQCSWVHKSDPEKATLKAKDLVRMAVAKARILTPLPEPRLDIDPRALVIGGGIAGMTAAKMLSENGCTVYLIEKEAALGGNARRLFDSWKGENIREYLNERIDSVVSDPRISVYLNAGIDSVEGFVGNFKTTVSVNGSKERLEHGVTIIAAGASEYKPEEFLYGEDERVVTALELQERFLGRDPALGRIDTAVFIQCVGSRIPERPYCSKVCCTRSIRNALALKSLRPDMRIFVLYRDMRSYGLREELYRKARSEGIVFIPYDDGRGLSVERNGGAIEVTFTDRVLKRGMELHPDLLVLATAVVSNPQNRLAQLYKVQQNSDGFFIEAHVKLRPVDCASDGVFICGLAHSPKPIDEAVVEAQAAATRAGAVLFEKTRTVSGTVSYVDAAKCSGCGTCVSLCAFNAPRINEKTGKAEIEATLCKGCGLCTASCRSGAAQQKGFETEQIMEMIACAV